VTVTDDNGASVDQLVTVTVTGTNDKPTIVAGGTTPTGAITELASQTGDSTDQDQVSGTIAFKDVDLNDTHTVSQAAPTFTWSGGELSGDQKAALTTASTLALVETDSTHTGAGSVGWTYSITDSALDFLAAGQKLTVKYTVTIDDGHGGTVSKLVTVTVTGTNDAPTIVAGSTTATGSLTENAQGTSETTSGTIAFQDVDLSDHHTVSRSGASFDWSGGTLSAAQQAALTTASTLTLVKTDSTNSGAGSVGWTYKVTDSAIDFLAAGETLTVTYTVTVDDGHGGTASQPVTVTVTGTNDAPTIAAGTTATGTLTEDAQGHETGSETVSGTIAFKDVDLNDTHTASQAAPTFTWSGGDLTDAQKAALTATSTLILAETDSTNSGAGSVGWTYTVTDSALDFLAKGETLTVTYSVTVIDNNGASTSQPVTVTVTGTNDKPAIVAGSTTAIGAITEVANTTGDTTDPDHASGTIAFNDVDLDDTHTVSQAAPSFVWSGGTLSAAQKTALTQASTLTLVETDSTHSGAGSVDWTYSAADSTFDFLAAGETLTITYNVTVKDNYNASVSQTVTVTVTGTNDAPTIVAGSTTATGAITELANKTGDTTDQDHVSGTIGFKDVDLDDTHTVSQAAPSLVWSGGTLTDAQKAALTAASTLTLAETTAPTQAPARSAGPTR
jgi:VCBS repeat-containing protein